MYIHLLCLQAKFLQSCLTLCNPIGCSPLGSSVHGILPARILSGLPCPPPGDLPDPRIKPMSLKSPALAGRFFTISATGEAHVHLLLPFMSLISQTLFMRWFSLRVIYRNKILLSVVIDKSQLFRTVRSTEEALDKYLLKEGRDGWINFSWDWNYIFKHWITSRSYKNTISVSGDTTLVPMISKASKTIVYKV